MRKKKEGEIINKTHFFSFSGPNVPGMTAEMRHVNAGDITIIIGLKSFSFSDLQMQFEFNHFA